ncbi:hypothetical protein HOC13_04510 [Candidatus Woesearchaeota archaeon]|jgi:histone H3/H4|nr:hypothetical protein [Candidatus Woesearchaeota archaeon]
MISKNKIKEIAKESNKKLSEKAYKKLEKEIHLILKERIKDAAINADFNARKIIKEEDLD